MTRPRLSLMARWAGSARFHAWAVRTPIVRHFVRREGEAMMGLISGFVQSQCLSALIEVGILEALQSGPCDVDELARIAQMPPERALVLVRAGVALGLVRLQRGERTARLTVRGAALMGVAGLSDMIRHHKVLYQDLSDPGAFFRGQSDPELSRFWPYVFASEDAPSSKCVADADAARYSSLMARSQALVAQDTLAAIDLRHSTRLLDVGGGSGAFVSEVARAYPDLSFSIFDLPAVVETAHAHLAGAGVAERVEIVAGSFRESALPRGADAVSLIRVCYDHEDVTVAALFSSVFESLPDGGQLIISEPMTGGPKPTISGDVYFQSYTLAMGTGKTRSQEQIAQMVRAAGFRSIKTPKPRRPFVTSVVLARK